MKAAAAGQSTIGIPQSVGQDFASAGYPKAAPERVGIKGENISGKYSMEATSTHKKKK